MEALCIRTATVGATIPTTAEVASHANDGGAVVATAARLLQTHAALKNLHHPFELIEPSTFVQPPNTKWTQPPQCWALFGWSW